jgi:hypothetical protein
LCGNGEEGEGRWCGDGTGELCGNGDEEDGWWCGGRTMGGAKVGGGGWAVVQPVEPVKESIEGNEDLIPDPPYPENLVCSGLVAMLLAPTLRPDLHQHNIRQKQDAYVPVATDLASSSCSSSSFIKCDRGGFTSPLPDSCLLTFALPPNPVKFANGSSSNRKSGGGELRGEVKPVEFCLFECGGEGGFVLFT